MRDAESLVSREKDLLSLKQKAEKDIRKLGFTAPDMPDKKVELPDNVSAISGKELGRLYNRMISWESYASYKLALVNLEELVLEYALSLSILKEQNKYDGGIQSRKAEAMTSRRVREANYQYKKICTVRILMQATYDRYEKNSAYISREITRRQNEST